MRQRLNIASFRLSPRTTEAEHSLVPRLRLFVLQAMESWAAPGNEAMFSPLSMFFALDVCAVGE